MQTAKLVDLVVNLIIYPCFVVLDTIVEQCLIYIFLAETIHNLDKEPVIKLDKRAEPFKIFFFTVCNSAKESRVGWKKSPLSFQSLS